MTLLAHLSDLHLVEARHRSRRGLERLRLSYLTLGRTVDAAARLHRARAALAAARSAGADHLVVTGDLTEDGTDAQLELVAELLHESGLDPERVTLVPGNHDGYADPASWRRALEGPLRAFADSCAPSAIVPLDDAFVLPLSTLRPQPFTRSAGVVGAQQLDALARWVRRLGRRRPVIVAQHHPPHAFAPGLHWLDGLLDHEALGAVLAAHAHVHVLHGHTHARSDRDHGSPSRPRVYGASAVFAGGAPLRLYRVADERLEIVEPAGSP